MLMILPYFAIKKKITPCVELYPWLSHDVFDATPGTSRFGNVEASFEIGSSWGRGRLRKPEENRGKMVSWCLKKHAETRWFFTMKHTSSNLTINNAETSIFHNEILMACWITVVQSWQWWWLDLIIIPWDLAMATWSTFLEASRWHGYTRCFSR